jgi:hypothetical protein
VVVLHFRLQLNQIHQLEVYRNFIQVLAIIGTKEIVDLVEGKALIVEKDPDQV